MGTATSERKTNWIVAVFPRFYNFEPFTLSLTCLCAPKWYRYTNFSIVYMCQYTVVDFIVACMFLSSAVRIRLSVRVHAIFVNKTMQTHNCIVTCVHDSREEMWQMSEYWHMQSIMNPCIELIWACVCLVVTLFRVVFLIFLYIFIFMCILLCLLLAVLCVACLLLVSTLIVSAPLN